MMQKILFLIKGKIELLLISFVAVFVPLVHLLIAVGLVIAIDFVFGIWRAIHVKEKVTSRKMSATVGKMLLYQLMIISLFLVEKFMMGGLLPITQIGASFLGLIELKSISESFEIIYNVNLFNKIKLFFSRGENKNKNIFD